MSSRRACSTGAARSFQQDLPLGRQTESENAARCLTGKTDMQWSHSAFPYLSDPISREGGHRSNDNEKTSRYRGDEVVNRVRKRRPSTDHESEAETWAAFVELQSSTCMVGPPGYFRLTGTAL